MKDTVTFFKFEHLKHLKYFKMENYKRYCNIFKKISIGHFNFLY